MISRFLQDTAEGKGYSDKQLREDEQRHLSKSLEKVMEDAGISKDMIRLRRDRWFEFEILTTLGERLRNFQMSVYVFGSQIEGTTIPELASDIDVLICDDKIPVVETIDMAPTENKSYLLCRDKTVPAGYARIQVLRDGQPTNFNPHNLHLVEENKVYLNNNVLKRVLSKFAIPLRASNQSVSGPAATITSSVFGEMYDLVGAFRCRIWPSFADSLFTRSKPYNWPTLAMLEIFKSLGCFLVPVGHPTSPQQETEWRISFSLQERLLVHSFNYTQLKCYILLKILKKEIIFKLIVEKSLTSYHLKTCLFYLLERTEQAFWIPGNLLCCMQRCLEQILVWIENGFCPNYFIPEENMFDRHVHRAVQERLQCILKNLLHDNFNFIFELKTISMGEILSNNETLDSWKMKKKLSNQITKLQIQSKALEYRISETNRLLHIAEKKNIRDFITAIDERIAKLHQIDSITEHTRDQTEIVKRRILPYFQLSRHCNLMTEECQNQALVETLTWDDFNIENDHMSQKLKLAIYLFGKNENISSLQVLMELEQRLGKFIVSVCGCSAHQKCQILITKWKSGLLSEEELDSTCFTPCISFLSTEGSLLSLPLRFEMARTFGFKGPTGLRMIKPEHYKFWFKWAIVDGKFLMYFMLFVVAERLNMTEIASDAVQNMEHVIDNDPDLGHKETCLNLLGCVYKQRGLVREALKCFRDSYKMRPRYNAAILHIICWIADHVRL